MIVEYYKIKIDIYFEDYPFMSLNIRLIEFVLMILFAIYLINDLFHRIN